MLNLEKKLETGENVALVLEKGQNLSKVRVGLGWDVRTSAGSAFDLDALVLLLNENGKIHSNTSESVAYFGNKNVLGGTVIHHGDNLTGAGAGDDEVVDIDLSRLPESVKRVLIGVCIYDAVARGQNFGQVNNAFARVFLPDNSKFVVDGSEVTEIRYDLTEDNSASYTVELAELYRHNGQWKMKGLGKGSKETLKEWTDKYVA